MTSSSNSKERSFSIKLSRPLRTLFIVALTAVGAFSLSACSDDDNSAVSPDPVSGTMLRVIHMSYDAPAVDVWVDGSKAVSNLAYGMSSGYADVPAGSRNVKVVPAGQTSPVVIEADLTLQTNQKTTVFATDRLASITPVVATDVAPSSKARVRLVHTAPDAPAVDVKVGNGNGAALFTAVSFKNVTNYIDLDAGTYDLAVTAHGSTAEVVVLGGVTLENGKVYSVVARGTLDGNDNTPFEVRAFIDDANGAVYADLQPATTMVKVIHASPDAPAVDLYVDGLKAGSGLAFPNNTGYLTVGAGTRALKVTPSGSMNAVIDAAVRFDARRSYSVFATGSVSALQPLVIEDDLTAPAMGMAHVRFLHLSPDAPAVDITTTDGTVVFGNVSFRGSTVFTPLPAGSYDLQVRLAGTATKVLDLPGVSVASGKIYTVFARGFVSGSGTSALNAEIIVNKN